MNATELSRRLGQQAEAVCRRYLSNGCKEGRYWLVGNVDNVPGRSLYVRLVDGEKGPAGKWTDAATGDHGDLLDIIGHSVRAAGMRETLSEARRFLSLPEAPAPAPRSRPLGLSCISSGQRDAALRLWSGSHPTAGTLAQAYLQSRGLEAGADLTALRFHPGCHYRPSSDDPSDTPPRWPALIAAVTNNAGAITGVHRTWLDPSGKDKAPVANPRKTMGAILGHAVRFGVPTDRMIIGEGIETMLSLRACLPAMPLAACTSSAHLAAFLFPAGVNRLYVARDRDKAGEAAFAAIAERCATSDIEVIPLMPILGDFNDDLRQCAREAIQANLARQLGSGDEALLRKA